MERAELRALIDVLPRARLLAKLLAVELRFVSPDQLADAGRFGLSSFMDEAAEEYRQRGHTPYVIKSSPFPPGPVGYVAAAIELLEQLEERDATATRIY